MAQEGEGQTHGSDGKDSGSERSGKHQQKLADDKVQPGDRAGQDGFNSSALFLAGGEIDRRVHRSREAQQDYGIADKPSNTRAANFFRWRDVFLFDAKRRQDTCGQILGRQTILDDGITVFLNRFLQVVGAKGRLEFALVEVNVDRLRSSFGKSSLESLGDFGRGTDFLIGNLIL